MSEALSLIRETVESLVQQHCAPHSMPLDTVWQPELWAALVEVGFTGIGIADENGGGGGDLADAAEVLRLLSRASAAVPFAESTLLASHSLAAVERELPDGPLAFAAVAERPAAGTALSRIAWADLATHLVLVTPGEEGAIALVARAAYTVEHGTNLADEPRDDLTLTEPPHFVAARSDADALETRAALVRAVAISGALEGVLDLSVRYAREREQFGRPIARFQAVQDMLASLASEVVSVRAAVDAAIDAYGSPAERFAAAVAKARASAAAGPASRTAHQVHGALGFTDEHVLGRLTRRLWAWRDEDGNERRWARAVGVAVLDADGALWPTLAGS